MAFLRINNEKCKKDNICVAECPVRILIASNDGNAPTMRPGGEDICLECGHCVAVCPWDALELEPIRRDDCDAIEGKGKEKGFTVEQAVSFLKTRRSIRTFKKKAVSAEILDEIIDTLRFAPSAKNERPVHWVLVETPEKMQELTELCIQWMIDIRQNNPAEAKKYGVAGVIAAWKRHKLDLVLNGAPHLLVACTVKDSMWAKTDADIALAYAELSAHAHGVGACFAGYFTYAVNDSAEIRSFLNIDDSLVVHGAQMLGYPQYRYFMIPFKPAVAIHRVK